MSVDADDRLLGIATVKLDQINKPELVVNTCPLGAVVVLGKPVLVPVGVGIRVNVKPSVVSLVVAPTLGRKTVSLPTTTTPEFDTTLTPLGKTVVCGTFVGC